MRYTRRIMCLVVTTVCGCYIIGNVARIGVAFVIMLLYS